MRMIGIEPIMEISTDLQSVLLPLEFILVRIVGIEPTTFVPKTKIIPFNYILKYYGGGIMNLR